MEIIGNYYSFSVNIHFQDSLRRYFKKDCEKIHTLTEAIQKQCASLPQNDIGKEIREVGSVLINSLKLNCSTTEL